MPSILPNNIDMNKPVGLPRGTVRAVITFMLVSLSGVMLFVPVVDEDVKNMFLLLTGIAVRDYFASRAADDRADAADPPVPDAVVNE